MGLREIKDAISELSPRQVRALSEWLLANGGRAREESGDSDLVEERVEGAVTYRLEQVRCGKDNCRCRRGQEHGPYWYAYWSEGGKTRSKYIGKRLLTEHMQSDRTATGKRPK
jgi:hypothetical protein